MSSENFMRVSQQDASHALKHDDFFKFCEKAETDDQLAEEAQVVSSLKYNVLMIVH